MTTRFKDNDLTEGLTGAIHETGHALYEQGRNLDYDGLPVNQVAPLTSYMKPTHCGYEHPLLTQQATEIIQLPCGCQKSLIGFQTAHP